MSTRPQPMIAVTDVEASSRWYQQVLGAESGHTVDGLGTAVARCRNADARVETDVHVNPNSGSREIWLRDPDGYLVVLAEPY